MRSYEEIKNFIFCDNRKCLHVECLRHIVNTPYNVIITVSKKFETDKNGICKDMVIE